MEKPSPVVYFVYSPIPHDNQFVSCWFGVVKVMQTEENIYLLTATVLHSQALSDDPLQLWVALQKFGSVMCAHCITAWQGECNLLFVYFYSKQCFVYNFVANMASTSRGKYSGFVMGHSIW